jgi:5-methylcytosine-specific restriction endonuclease McrA
MKALLQKEVNSSCPFCSNDDVDHFQIHHIDENPENNTFENLIMVCAICHSKITKKDIAEAEVKVIKHNLSNTLK